MNVGHWGRRGARPHLYDRGPRDCDRQPRGCDAAPLRRHSFAVARLNVDTAWQLMQREYLLSRSRNSAAKVGASTRGGEGNLNDNLPPGQGITDWHGVVQALKRCCDDGFLSLEMGQYREPRRYAASGKAFLERVTRAVEEGV